MGRAAHPDILLALPHALAVGLDLLVDAVANALRIRLPFQPGIAFVIGLEGGGPEEGREGVGIRVGAECGGGPGGGDHGGRRGRGRGGRRERGPCGRMLGVEAEGKGGAKRREDGFIEFMCWTRADDGWQ